ncbi:hypothetical protein NE237_026788 [Protea cynaroides]|uniref:RING-type E3 ubiquitin transferase n=1 Tax=Protea cynaroides TaxID=273540 RepID=A0A9Q0GLB8_9MAGN|nr:hypothetical protein NE237_026788 [Protea cynaroides]
MSSTVLDLHPPPNSSHSSHSSHSSQTQPFYTAPPVTVTLTFVLFVFFFAGLFSIFLYRFFMGYVTAFSDSRQNTVLPTASVSNGLDPSIIATFPKLVYSSVKDLRQDKCGLECAVCLLEFEDNDELRLLTVCNHVFHPECIDLWFGNHTTCPLCRSSLLPPENDVTKEDEVEEHEEEVVVVVVVEGGDSHEGATSGAMASQDGGQHGEEMVERFSRSHSTGHSIIHVESNDDRYTLRLPDHHHVKDHIARGHYWTGSCTTFGEFSSIAGTRKPGWLYCRDFPAVM